MSPLPPGLVIAAPRSGAGKTTVALGLMRAFSRTGIDVQPFKNGPDYIDPAFHTRACGRTSFNLDSWAMPAGLMSALLTRASGAALVLAEGSMGLFDGGAQAGESGIGATADIAAQTGWPVLLVLDVSGQAQSAAAVALGCARLRPDVQVAGVILNRVASDRHHRLASQAIEAAGLPVVGSIVRDDRMGLAERHLGLIPPEEVTALDAQIDLLADVVARQCDLGRILKLAAGGRVSTADRMTGSPPAQRIAIARDAAFVFTYPHVLSSWQAAGAEITLFSPLADEGPDPSADLAWLPGGYPELHASTLAGNETFHASLRRFSRDRPVHGECGGYMVLGQGLVDADGVRHPMTGLLGLETDFSKRKLHLGYRACTLLDASPLGRRGDRITGHEFHYARAIDLGGDPPLLEAVDASGQPVPALSSRRDHVSGTFFHFIAKTG